MKKIFLIIGLLFLAAIAFADYNNYPPMADKYLLPDGSIKTFSGVVVAPPDASRATKYKTMDMIAAKWLMPDGSLVSALPFSGGGSANVTGLTIGTNATLTVSDAVNATITAPLGTAAYGNLNSLNITGGNVTGITNFSATTGNVTTLKWGQKVSTFTTAGNANVTDQNGGLIDIYGAANTTVTLTTVVSGMHFDVLCSNTDCCIDTTDTWNVSGSNLTTGNKICSTGGNGSTLKAASKANGVIRLLWSNCTWVDGGS